MASTFYNTVDPIDWLDVYTLSTFSGVMYWAFVSVLIIPATLMILAVIFI